MAYCRDLGHGAIKLLLEDDNARTGVMVSMAGGALRGVKFEEMIEPGTNRTQVRHVDLKATSYLVARAYMIRLERADFESPAALTALAAEAKMTPHEFRQRFEHVVRRVHREEQGHPMPHAQGSEISTPVA